ncbi:MAG TPA: hypothetical protein VKU40_05660, partial [Thermoanaerobaculia bacterium]|nr:hypothetical protein [Thermoanaerobaculia bacterium]
MKLRNATLCLVAAFLLAAPWIAAQEPPAADEGGDQPPAPVETRDDDKNDDDENAATGPRVVCAYLFAASAEPQTEPQKCADDGGSGLVYLGDRLAVRVSGLGDWLEAEEKERGELRLFLDGVEITELEAEAVQA